MIGWRGARLLGLLVVLLGIGPAACAGAGTGLVVVSVKSTRALTGVGSFEAVVSGSSRINMAKATYPAPDGGVALSSTMIVTLGLKVPGDSGAVIIVVRALAGDGKTVIASGTSLMVTPKAGARVDVEVTLGDPAPVADGGADGSGPGADATDVGGSGGDGSAGDGPAGGSGGASGAGGSGGAGGGSDTGGNECSPNDRRCFNDQPQRCEAGYYVNDGPACAEPSPACESGQCVCPDPGTNCANLNRCINTSTDPHACGSCTHDCRMGTCTGGQCDPFVIASGRTMASMIAVDANFVYFSDMTAGGEISRASKDGSNVTKVADIFHPTALAVDGGDLYVASLGGSVLRFPGGSAPSITIASNQDNIYGMAVRGPTVYWADLGARFIRRAPKTGGGMVVDMSNENGDRPEGLAIDATNVYWANNDASAVRKLPLGADGTTAALNIAIGQVQAHEVAVDANNVYWLAKNPTDVVMAAPIAGGAAMQIAIASGLGPGGASGLANGIMSDGSFVYYYDSNSFAKVAPEGGAVVRSQVVPGPESFTMDATTIYWTNWEDKVYAMAKF